MRITTGNRETYWVLNLNSSESEMAEKGYVLGLSLDRLDSSVSLEIATPVKQ